jgi:hypothetical protein
MSGWFKREVATAGRQRVMASIILFWAPIFLTAIALFVIWLIDRISN